MKSEVGAQLGRKDLDLKHDAGKYFVNKISAKENSFLVSQHFRNVLFLPKAALVPKSVKFSKQRKFILWHRLTRILLNRAGIRIGIGGTPISYCMN